VRLLGQPIWETPISRCYEQGCGVGGKMCDSNSDLSKISDSDSLISREWSLAVNNFVVTSTQCKSWYTARIICFNKRFGRNCTVSKWIPNLGLWWKKLIHLNCRSMTQNPTPTPTPTPSVVRNPSPPKNLRLPATPTPTPQPWYEEENE